MSRRVVYKTKRRTARTSTEDQDLLDAMRESKLGSTSGGSSRGGGDTKGSSYRHWICPLENRFWSTQCVQRDPMSLDIDDYERFDAAEPCNRYCEDLSEVRKSLKARRSQARSASSIAKIDKQLESLDEFARQDQRDEELRRLASLMKLKAAYEKQ